MASEGHDETTCRSCGACCACCADWPRFTLEDDEALARIPQSLVSEDGSGMRCARARCGALLGEVGSSTSCSIYTDRPQVCRDCLPGDEACRIARLRFGLEPLQ